MDVMIKSSLIPFELTDGTEIELTLNFRRLLNVRNKRKDIYDKYNKVMMNGPEDIYESIIMLYTAYLCGLEDIDTAMSYDEFLDKMPPYMEMVNRTVMSLTRPKKPEASEKRSGAENSQKSEG